MRLIDADALKKWTDEHYDFEEFAVGYFVKIIQDIPTVDAIPVSFIKEMKAWAEENGSAEYANDLTHLLSVWAERKEE